MSMASTKRNLSPQGKFSAEGQEAPKSARVTPGFAVASEHLPSLVAFAEGREALKRLIGPISAFVVVVDANILIGELLWLSGKRRNPHATPALLECMVAKTMIVRVTGTIIGEVERAMECLARERHIPDGVWRSHWAKYKLQLLIEDPDPVVVAKFASGRDPTDAPTLALAECIANSGILTKDRDLKAMGGNVLPFEFKLDVRDYSRKAAVFVSLQIGGYYICIGTIDAFRSAVRAIKHVGECYRALPDGVKLLAIFGILFALLHPKSRGMIVGGIGQLGEAASSALPPILSCLIHATKVAQDNRPVPPAVRHL